MANRRKVRFSAENDGGEAEEIRWNAEFVLLHFFVNRTQRFADGLIVVEPHQLQLCPALVNDVQMLTAGLKA